MKELFYSRLLDTKLVKANSALLSSLDIYHLIPNPHSRNNYWIYITLAQFWSQNKKGKRMPAYKTDIVPLRGACPVILSFQIQAPLCCFQSYFFYQYGMVFLFFSETHTVNCTTHPWGKYSSQFLYCYNVFYGVGMAVGKMNLSRINHVTR